MDRERERRLSWRLAVVGKGPCIVTGEADPTRLEAHHVIPQSKLRRVARDQGRDVEGLLWDARNGVPLEHAVHRRHTLAVERVPYDVLPAEAHEFAHELGLAWYVERFYPKRADVAPDAALAAVPAVSQGDDHCVV